MLRLRPAAVVLAATALVASGSGCGKSASTTSTQATSSAPVSSTAPISSTAKPLTRAQLIAKADLICKRVNARHAVSSFDSKSAYTRLLPPLAAYQLAAVAAMRRLTPPASMAAAWQQMVGDALIFAQAVKKLGEDARANDLKAGRAVSLAGAQANTRMLAIAQREGFQDCAHATG